MVWHQWQLRSRAFGLAPGFSAGKTGTTFLEKTKTETL
jgi:hypothetical protein